eukprot:14310696-Alexandrium_andersonii.AAC.1
MCIRDSRQPLLRRGLRCCCRSGCRVGEGLVGGPLAAGAARCLDRGLLGAALQLVGGMASDTPPSRLAGSPPAAVCA